MIKYEILSHLYWGKYCYKVLVPFRYPVHRFREARRIEELSLLAGKIVEPENDSWYSSVNSAGKSYYFDNDADALEFIETNKDHISVVVAPDENCDARKISDPQIRVRKRLYWDMYKISVQFKSKSNTDLIDGWIEEFFDIENHNNDGRFYYNYNACRKLFLNDASDLLAVQIALGEHISHVHIVRLPEAIKNDEK